MPFWRFRNLNFHKWVGPLRNGREPIFVTIHLPEFISDQAVRLAFSSFGDVVTVFKGRHEFNRKIRNGKGHVKIFPAEEYPAILPRKISFHGRIQRDVLFAEKEVLCYSCKTRHMLGENCPVATPITEDFGMSLNEKSDTPGRIWLLCNQSLLLRLSLQGSLNRHLLLIGGSLGRGILLWWGVGLWFWFRLKLRVWRWEWVWIGVFSWAKSSFGEPPWLAFSGRFVCCSEGSS